MPQVLRAENAEQAGQKFPRIIERGEQHACPLLGEGSGWGSCIETSPGKQGLLDEETPSRSAAVALSLKLS